MSLETLPTKKVLLIMPNFFDYPMQIIQELRSKGFEVDFFDDRPSTSSFMKAAIRINRNFVGRYTKRYFEFVYQRVSSTQYDFLILISGQSLSFTEAMIEKLQSSQHQMKSILYQWDSIENFPIIKDYHHFFDKIYTFDPDDAKQYGLSFLPLFYTEKYQKIGVEERNFYPFDFCFIGTAHPQKYQFIKKMAAQLLPVYPDQFIYYYLPSRMLFFYRKLTSKAFTGAKFNTFHYVPLSGNDFEQVYMNSRCVLDAPQSGQNGLTIRVIESLGANKKIITTNKDVVNYDFYRPENIYVYNGEFDFESPFFQLPFKPIESEIYLKYALHNWLNVVLS